MDKLIHDSDIDALVSTLVSNQNNTESEYYENQINESIDLVNETTMMYNQLPANLAINNLMALQNPQQSGMSLNLAESNSLSNVQANLSNANYPFVNMTSVRVDDPLYHSIGYSNFNTTNYLPSNLTNNNFAYTNYPNGNVNYNRNTNYVNNSNNNNFNRRTAQNYQQNYQQNNQQNYQQNHQQNYQHNSQPNYQQNTDYSRSRRPIQAQQQRKGTNNAFNKLMDLACSNVNNVSNPNYSNRQSNYHNQSHFNGSTYNSYQNNVLNGNNRSNNYAGVRNYSGNQNYSNDLNYQNHNSSSSQNYSINQYKQNNNQQTCDRLPCLRSIRAPKTKVASKSLSPEVNITSLIEQCVEHLNCLRKEINQLDGLLSGSKADAEEYSLSSGFSDQGPTIDGVLDLSFQEFYKIDKMVKDHTFFDKFNELFQTAFCTFQIWFNQMQVVRYASQKIMIKLDLDNLSAEALFSSSLESTGSSHINQLLRCIREVRTSIWCVYIIAASQQGDDLADN